MYTGVINRRIFLSLSCFRFSRHDTRTRRDGFVEITCSQLGKWRPISDNDHSSMASMSRRLVVCRRHEQVLLVQDDWGQCGLDNNIDSRVSGTATSWLPAAQTVYATWIDSQSTDTVMRRAQWRTQQYAWMCYKSNKIKVGVNEITVIDGEMCARWKTKLGQYRRYKSWDSLCEYRLRRKGRVEEMGFQLFKKRGVERSETGEFKIGEGVTWWATWRRSEWRLCTACVSLLT